MTTTTSKSVPRSRLNITYRTRIDGRVVQKELPLRLLVAANFSGRRMKDPFGKEIPGRDLPLLDRRLMYAIGKSGNLESVMKLMRIGLPVPDQLTHFRKFEVSGHANVRFTSGGEDVVLVQLLHAEIEGAAVASAGNGQDTAKGKQQAEYQGQLQSFLAVEFGSKDVDGGKTLWSPGKAGEPTLSGWLEPKRQSPREPAVMYEVSGWDELELTSDMVDPSSIPQGGMERRVQIRATLKARHVIPLLDMKSFDPERIAETVPEIRRLLVLRWLVSQGRSMIASNPILRTKCKELLPSGQPATDGDAAESPLGSLKAMVEVLNQEDVFRLHPSEDAAKPADGSEKGSAEGPEDEA